MSGKVQAHPIKASVDFGTEGTAVCIAQNASMIFNLPWPTSDGSISIDNSKTRTCVLVHAGTFAPVQFGSSAHAKYADLLQRDPDTAAKKYLLFDYFKMSLANDDKAPQAAGPRNPMVTATTGEKAPAVKIITAAFSLIYDSVFEHLTKSSKSVKSSDIGWCVTVPTMWSEAARQIMSQSVMQACQCTAPGQVQLCLEPEAATLCCRNQQMTRQLVVSNAATSMSDLLKVGTKMIVLDLGAGTDDVSQLMVNQDCTLKETAAASGGPWGGHLVEINILKLFDSAFGAEKMLAYKKTEPIGHHELVEGIRRIKHSADPSRVGGVSRLQPPYSFIRFMGLDEKQKALKAELFLTFTLPDDRAQAPTYDSQTDSKSDSKADAKAVVKAEPGAAAAAAAAASGSAGAKPDTKTPEAAGASASASASPFVAGNAGPITLSYKSNGQLQLSDGLVQWAFGQSLRGITGHLDQVLTANKGATIVFMVGGFSESRIVQKAVDAVLDKHRSGRREKLPASAAFGAAAAAAAAAGAGSAPASGASGAAVAGAGSASAPGAAPMDKDGDGASDDLKMFSGRLGLAAFGSGSPSSLGSFATPPSVPATAAPAVKKPEPEAEEPVEERQLVRVVPLAPSMCVVLGAVHFAINPTLITSRISAKTFGIGTSHPWNESRHQGKQWKYLPQNGVNQKYCTAVLKSFVKKGDVVEVDSVKTETFSPGSDNQTEVEFALYASTKTDVNFIDDPSVAKVGAVTLRIPWNSSYGSGLDRSFEVSMTFGTNEIGVEAHEVGSSSNQIRAVVDFIGFDLGGESRVRYI